MSGARASARLTITGRLGTSLVALALAVPLAGIPASSGPAATDDAVTRTVDVVVRTVGAGLSHARDIVVRTGGSVLLPLPIVDGFSARVTPGGLATLEATPGLLVTPDEAVGLHHESTAEAPVTDSAYVETVGADDLHKEGIDGTGVGIAVIDTGVTEVVDLEGRIVGALDLSGDGDHVDQYGHGTFLAGIAAGDGTASKGKHAGVAPGAHVVPVKIAGRTGASDISHVLAAIQYVVSFRDEYDIGVLNLSLGTDSTQPQALSPLNHAVERAWDAGIVVVVSGGNHGEDGPGRIPKPADDPLVITVGATDSEGTIPRHDDTVAAYSSRGPSIADGIVKPDIVAPGSHLVGTKAPGSYADVTFPGAHVGADYMRGSGTSFAAALTSGAVALLRQAHPDWTPDQVKGAITASATPGPVGDRNVDGHGALDVAAAAALRSPPAANQDVSRSTGLGTLADDRGSLQVEIEKPDALLGTILMVLQGEATAQDLLFSSLDYTTTEWTASKWYASKWYASKWYASKWYASKWYASKWYADEWS